MIWAAIGVVLGVQLATLWALAQMNDKMDRYHWRIDGWGDFNSSKGGPKRLPS